MDAVKQSLLALVLVLLPRLAAACPNCIGASRNNDVLKLIGAFMLVPFVIFYLVLRVIRRAQREVDIVEK